jgi:hypothetical protein
MFKTAGDCPSGGRSAEQNGTVPFAVVYGVSTILPRSVPAL